MTALRDAAMRYALHHWHVIPLAPRGKRPLIEDWPRLASCDERQVTEWWRKWPDANLGLAPALSGLVVFDVDSAKAEATAAFLGLTAEPTLTVTTGRTDFPGRHLYYEAGVFRCGNLRLLVQNDRLGTVSGDQAGLEVKSAAGQVVLPPSIHPSGRVYRWAGSVADLRPLPAGAIEALRRLTGTGAPRTPIGATITLGSIDNTLIALAGALRRRGASEAIILAALRGINAECVEPPAMERDLRRIAKSAGRYPPVVSLADHYRKVVGA